MQIKLTDKAVSSLKAGPTRYEVWDASRPAFGVRVGKTGKKSFVFVYHFQGRARRMTLGQYPMTSLADAAIALAKAQKALLEGLDPGGSEVERRRQQRAAPTVGDLACEYVEKHGRPNKKSWFEDKRVLDHDVLPAWEKRKIHSIKRQDVYSLIDEIAKRAPVQANRTLAVIRAMFNFAISRDYLDTNPCARVKRPTVEKSRDRVLEMPEIARLLNGILTPGITDTLRLAIKFLLLTGQRIGEVTNAEWSEIDFENAIWTLPGSKVKSGRPHRVPLSRQALQVLRDAKKLCQGMEKRRENPRNRDLTKWSDRDTAVKWVFASRYGDRPITTRSIDRALRRLNKLNATPDFHPHDLRRTCASHMTRLGVSRLTVLKLLNHSDKSVTAIYDRYDYDEEKKQAVQIWADEVDRQATQSLIRQPRIPGIGTVCEAA
jgi:integrase